MKSRSRIIVRYAETDQMGVVHHAVYPVWYEVSRTDFIKQVGMTYSQMEQMGIMLPLIELQCRYLLPAHYEDELYVEASIQQLTQVKIVFLYEIFTSDGKLIHTGSTTHAWTNTQLKPISLKKHFPDVYDLVLKAKEE